MGPEEEEEEEDCSLGMCPAGAETKGNPKAPSALQGPWEFHGSRAGSHPWATGAGGSRLSGCLGARSRSAPQRRGTRKAPFLP